MREILFRGKRVDNGEWIEGFYLREAGNFIKELPSIISTPTHLIIPDTIGQYTGLKDKNGKRIFEGDIVKIPFRRDYGVVRYEVPECHFEYVMQGDGDFIEFNGWASAVEVMGDVYDNPELLKETE